MPAELLESTLAQVSEATTSGTIMGISTAAPKRPLPRTHGRLSRMAATIPSTVWPMIAEKSTNWPV